MVSPVLSFLLLIHGQMLKSTVLFFTSLALLPTSSLYGQRSTMPLSPLRALQTEAAENRQVAPNVDVVISKVIARGVHQITLQLPSKTGNKDPRFEADFYLSTRFEVKNFTNEFPAVSLYPMTGKRIYVIAEGHTADRITATFNFEHISVVDFAHNPELIVTLHKNPYDLSGRKPYLEIRAVDISDLEFECYLPISGEMAFGKHRIPLFTNRLPSC